jgi:glycosyltransferase involved in cell wall biosynthesis
MLVRASIRAGLEVTVATTDDDGPGARLPVPLEQPVTGEDGATYYYFPRQLGFYTISWPLRQWLRRHVSEFAVIHTHALFSFASGAAAHAAQRHGIPYVVRPLGVLNRWGMENRRRFLKQWSVRLIELPLLRRAAAVHYTSTSEQREAAVAHPEIGKLSSAIIPLPIESSDRVETPDRFLQRFPTAAGRPIILFLSRIDAKKGLELLLPAFKELRSRFPASILVLAGAGEESYVAVLKQRARDLGIFYDVLWTGFLDGADKASALTAATIFVLPSFSENFGVAAAEALAAGVPSVLSDQVAISEHVSADEAGMVVPCEVGALAASLCLLMAEPATRARLGANARRLVAERFSFAIVGQQLRHLYESCIDRNR